MNEIWIFVGANAHFPSGVFSSRARAVAWIRMHGLTGCLTLYPIDVGVYEWAIEKDFFRPKREDQKSAEFIGRFSSASIEHYHFEDGESNDLPVE